MQPKLGRKEDPCVPSPHTCRSRLVSACLLRPHAGVTRAGIVSGAERLPKAGASEQGNARLSGSHSLVVDTPRFTTRCCHPNQATAAQTGSRGVRKTAHGPSCPTSLETADRTGFRPRALTVAHAAASPSSASRLRAEARPCAQPRLRGRPLIPPRHCLSACSVPDPREVATLRSGQAESPQEKSRVSRQTPGTVGLAAVGLHSKGQRSGTEL